jgi:hypothetical protein
MSWSVLNFDEAKGKKETKLAERKQVGRMELGLASVQHRFQWTSSNLFVVVSNIAYG